MKGSARKETLKKNQCPKVQVRNILSTRKKTGRARDCKKWGQMEPWNEPGLGSMEVTGDHTQEQCSDAEHHLIGKCLNLSPQKQTLRHGFKRKGLIWGGRVGSGTGKGSQPGMGLSGNFHIMAEFPPMGNA